MNEISKESEPDTIANDKEVSSSDLLASTAKLMITFSDIDLELRKHSGFYWFITSLDEQNSSKNLEQTRECLIKDALEEIANIKECPIAILVYHGLAWKVQRQDIQAMPEPSVETHLHIWIKKLL